MKNFLKVFLFLAFPAFAFANPCDDALGSEHSRIENLVNDANLMLQKRVPSPKGGEAQARLMGVFGIRETIVLFGKDLTKWPLVLGLSRDAHIILAKADIESQQIEILSYKRLDMTIGEYLAKLHLDMNVETGRTTPPERYLSLSDQLERSEGVFKKTQTEYMQETGLIFTADNGSSGDLTAVIRSNGVTKPWLARSTTVLRPVEHGTIMRKGSVGEITGFVVRLLGLR